MEDTADLMAPAMDVGSSSGTGLTESSTTAEKTTPEASRSRDATVQEEKSSLGPQFDDKTLMPPPSLPTNVSRSQSPGNTPPPRPSRVRASQSAEKPNRQMTIREWRAAARKREAEGAVKEKSPQKLPELMPEPPPKPISPPPLPFQKPRKHKQSQRSQNMGNNPPKRPPNNFTSGFLNSVDALPTPKEKERIALKQNRAQDSEKNRAVSCEKSGWGGDIKGTPSSDNGLRVIRPSPGIFMVLLINKRRNDFTKVPQGAVPFNFDKMGMSYASSMNTPYPIYQTPGPFTTQNSGFPQAKFAGNSQYFNTQNLGLNSPGPPSTTGYFQHNLAATSKASDPLNLDVIARIGAPIQSKNGSSEVAMDVDTDPEPTSSKETSTGASVTERKPFGSEINIGAGIGGRTSNLSTPASEETAYINDFGVQPPVASQANGVPSTMGNKIINSMDAAEGIKVNSQENGVSLDFDVDSEFDFAGSFTEMLEGDISFYPVEDETPTKRETKPTPNFTSTPSASEIGLINKSVISPMISTSTSPAQNLPLGFKGHVDSQADRSTNNGLGNMNPVNMGPVNRLGPGPELIYTPGGLPSGYSTPMNINMNMGVNVGISSNPPDSFDGHSFGNVNTNSPTAPGMPWSFNSNPRAYLNFPNAVGSQRSLQEFGLPRPVLSTSPPPEPLPKDIFHDDYIGEVPPDLEEFKPQRLYIPWTAFNQDNLQDLKNRVARRSSLEAHIPLPNQLKDKYWVTKDETRQADRRRTFGGNDMKGIDLNLRGVPFTRGPIVRGGMVRGVPVRGFPMRGGVIEGVPIRGTPTRAVISMGRAIRRLNTTGGRVIHETVPSDPVESSNTPFNNSGSRRLEDPQTPSPLQRLYRPKLTPRSVKEPPKNPVSNPLSARTEDGDDITMIFDDPGHLFENSNDESDDEDDNESDDESDDEGDDENESDGETDSENGAGSDDDENTYSSDDGGADSSDEEDDFPMEESEERGQKGEDGVIEINSDSSSDDDQDGLEDENEDDYFDDEYDEDSGEFSSEDDLSKLRERCRRNGITEDDIKELLLALYDMEKYWEEYPFEPEVDAGLFKLIEPFLEGAEEKTETDVVLKEAKKKKIAELSHPPKFIGPMPQLEIQGQKKRISFLDTNEGKPQKNTLPPPPPPPVRQGPRRVSFLDINKPSSPAPGNGSNNNEIEKLPMVTKSPLAGFVAPKAKKTSAPRRVNTQAPKSAATSPVVPSQQSVSSAAPKKGRVSWTVLQAQKQKEAEEAAASPPGVQDKPQSLPKISEQALLPTQSLPVINQVEIEMASQG
ncbi:hypothetical protein TWF751_011648 [Orbilia oligospora]|nr:hypothetical protein TWF751_011648 [Orbilia oligospora]